eukprot:5250267-Pleurochrysis_carterae.AAC.1
MVSTASSSAEQLATAARQRQWYGSRRAHQLPNFFPASCPRASFSSSGEERRCCRYRSAPATAGSSGAHSVKKLPKRPSDS